LESKNKNIDIEINYLCNLIIYLLSMMVEYFHFLLDVKKT